MKIRKQISIFAAILLFHYLFLIFIQNNLFPIHFDPKKLFAFDLIGKTFTIPSELLYVLEAGNLILLWIVSKEIFNKYSLILPLIYAISPWSSYLVAAGSIYIYLLFLILIGFYGLLILNSNKIIATILISGAVIILGYSSISLFFLIPIIFLLPLLKLYPLRLLKYSFLIIAIFLIPFFFLIQKNTVGFTNLLNNEIKVLSDPGLLNMVNVYQGVSQQQGLGKLAKMSENKYIFTLENVFVKYTKQFIPSNFFTSQEKMLNFSFSPPIFLGFLIPFVYGLFKIINLQNRRVLFISSLLVIPSVLSRNMVDLNRLVLFAPVVMIVISLGLIELFKQRQAKIVKFFLYLTIIFVVFQMIVVLEDIQTREKDRFTKYYEFERNFEVGKQ